MDGDDINLNHEKPSPRYNFDVTITQETRDIVAKIEQFHRLNSGLSKQGFRDNKKFRSLAYDLKESMINVKKTMKRKEVYDAVIKFTPLDSLEQIKNLIDVTGKRNKKNEKASLPQPGC